MAEITPDQSGHFLTLPNIAHFITLRADGSPHVVPLWYEFAEDRFFVFTKATSVKMQNLRRNPQCTLSIASAIQPYSYVVASGTAKIENSDVIERAVSIASRYEGSPGGAKYIQNVQTRFVIALVMMVPTRMVGWVNSTDQKSS